MGASEWVYFVPYQVDVEQALQELRAQVFAEQGKDLQIYPSWWRQMTLEEFLPPDPDLSADDIAMYTEEFARLQALPEPTTIEELIGWNGAEGTSTILDMEHISPEPSFGTLSPLSDREVLRIFGTQQPSHSQVKQAIQQQQIDLPEREQGIYIVVYQEGLPDELCFIGVSGD